MKKILAIFLIAFMLMVAALLIGCGQEQVVEELDENGVPPAAEARLDTARRILMEAETHGIPVRDILIDCGTPAIGAPQRDTAETLKTLRLVKENLPAKTVLGGSLDAKFLSAALDAGLDAAMTDPLSPDIMEIIDGHCSQNGK